MINQFPKEWKKSNIKICVESDKNNYVMKKILKFIAQFILIWMVIGVVSITNYAIIIKPMLAIYNKYGWEGALYGAFVIVIFYSIIMLIILGIEKLIDYATD